MTAAGASGCIVLVPFLDHIEPECEQALRALEGRGYRVRRWNANAAIDRSRSELATTALFEGFDELFWIDADMGFDPAAVDRIRSHQLPMVGGLYVMRGKRSFACRFTAGTKELTLGEKGGLLEVQYVGTGFLHTRRAVFEDVARKFSLPVCNAKYGSPTVPYFLPMVFREEAGSGEFVYLTEDYSFCERARQAGHKVMIDTSIRLWHLGRYAYSWEDFGAPVQRATNARIEFE